ncbi:MAG TPA: glycosyltransferase family 2 protein [Acidimicrobiales bacterium]
MELSIVMPCRDERETLEACVSKARRYLDAAAIDGEIIVVDNGSADGSGALARRLGVRVVDVPEPGYGAALMGGILAARGTFVVMGDADDSYDFSALDPFVAALREGADLVMGDRFAGGIDDGAMPPLHRYVGNPALSFLGRLFFHNDIKDFHCGLRAFRREAIVALDLQSPGMEFASEMVVKATLGGLTIAQVPTRLHRDGRSRPPHLRAWRDGWRHLRFLLLYSPRWLFFYPGLVMLVVGVGFGLVLTFTDVTIGPATLSIGTLAVCAGLVLIGYQSLWFALLSKTFASREGLLPDDRWVDQFRQRFPLELGLALAVVAVVAGVAGLVWAAAGWDFQPLDPIRSMRLILPSVTVLVLGLQTALCSLLLSILGLPSARPTAETAHEQRRDDVA